MEQFIQYKQQPCAGPCLIAKVYEKKTENIFMWKTLFHPLANTQVGRKGRFTCIFRLYRDGNIQRDETKDAILFVWLLSIYINYFQTYTSDNPH